MTLYSMMEIYNRHPSGIVIRAPPFLPPHPQGSPHPAHAFPLRIPIPMAVMHPVHNPQNPPSSPDKPTSSFRIADILNGTIGKRNGNHKPEPESARANSVMRPWDESGSRSSRSSSPLDEDGVDEEIDVGVEKPRHHDKSQKSPLDALFKMTSKTFEGLDGTGILAVDGETGEDGSLFSKNQQSKKRRKSRTAFTNQQIYELEKRFLYQKYLTPADRDEIAQQLGLSNAQVITWFQNRRAKLKRDLEELKADVSAAKVIGKESPSLITRLEEMQAYTTHHSFLKWDKKQLKVMSKYAPNFNPIPLPEDPIKRILKPSTESNNTNVSLVRNINENRKSATSEEDMEYSLDSEQEAAADRIAYERHRTIPIGSPLSEASEHSTSVAIDYSVDTDRRVVERRDSGSSDREQCHSVSEDTATDAVPPAQSPGCEAESDSESIDLTVCGE